MEDRVVLSTRDGSKVLGVRRKRIMNPHARVCRRKLVGMRPIIPLTLTTSARKEGLTLRVTVGDLQLLLNSGLVITVEHRVKI